MSYGIDPSTNVLKIMEENHYYPFGLKHAKYNTTIKDFGKQPDSNNIALKQIIDPGDKPLDEAHFGTYQYKYNGKEFQDELGLNLYDYGARNYDPAIGRWMNIDSKTEKFSFISPYVYVANNPVIFVDPDGKDIFIPNITGNPNTAENARNKKTILTNLQKLSNNTLKLVETRGGYLVRDTGVKFKDNQNKQLTEGTKLLNRLITSDKTVSIQQAKEGEVNLTNPLSNGNAKVTVDLNNNADGKKGNKSQNADGTYGRPPEIGLAHELIHADTFTNGERDTTKIVVANPDANTDPSKNSQGLKSVTDMDEVNTRNCENEIRAEQGVKPRASLVPLFFLPK